jgi:thymidylate synthase (FAD)
LEDSSHARGDVGAWQRQEEPVMEFVNLRSDVVVDLIDAMGGDASVVQAARVSVVGGNDQRDPERDAGLINYLMREKHGSPFEHNAFTFYVNAPIFVFREFQRHRIGWSYNEMSGRYTKLKPDFYSPARERPLVNVGSSAKPTFAAGEQWQWANVNAATRQVAQKGWANYSRLIDEGIANEVARGVLPVSIYSEMYATANARSIMNFLALRTEDERAVHHSRPQQEIQYVARQIEDIFAERFPITYAAFNEFGRVAP